MRRVTWAESMRACSSPSGCRTFRNLLTCLRDVFVRGAVTGATSPNCRIRLHLLLRRYNKIIDCRDCDTCGLRLDTV